MRCPRFKIKGGEHRHKNDAQFSLSIATCVPSFFSFNIEENIPCWDSVRSNTIALEYRITSILLSSSVIYHPLCLRSALPAIANRLPLASTILKIPCWNSATRWRMRRMHRMKERRNMKFSGLYSRSVINVWVAPLRGIEKYCFTDFCPLLFNRLTIHLWTLLRERSDLEGVIWFPAQEQVCRCELDC